MLSMPKPSSTVTINTDYAPQSKPSERLELNLGKTIFDASRILVLLHPSNGIIMIIEINISWAFPVVGYEVLISLRTLILSVSRQHALQTHANTLHILYWRPSLLTQKI